MSKGKRKTPSRVRYEVSHPTISCRVPKETYARLQLLKQKEARSFADVLKTGLGIMELKVKKDEKAYSRGYREGYRQAELEFKVTYACSVCGKTVALTSKKAKQAASEYMEEYHWGHAACMRQDEELP
jgi:predicted CopG family antitoxin